MANIYANLLKQEKAFTWEKSSTHRGFSGFTNMAAISLFLNTNMAAVTSCENALLYWTPTWPPGHVVANQELENPCESFRILLHTARHCIFNNRLIKHGYTLSDPLCTGIVSCYNGHLNMEHCPKIPDKPKDCARPKLKTINIPGKCCKKLWVCSGNWN